MDLDAIIAEMHRKPDAQVLLEWVYNHVSDTNPDTVIDAHGAMDAYFEAMEDQ